MCEEKGIIRGATIIDHITAIQDGGDPWNEENLQSLCVPCHNRKSGKEKRIKTK